MMSVTAGNISGNDEIVRTEESRVIMRRKDSNKMKVTAGDYLVEHDANAEYMTDWHRGFTPHTQNYVNLA